MYCLIACLYELIWNIHAYFLASTNFRITWWFYKENYLVIIISSKMPPRVVCNNLISKFYKNKKAICCKRDEIFPDWNAQHKHRNVSITQNNNNSLNKKQTIIIISLLIEITVCNFALWLLYKCYAGCQNHIIRNN